MQVLMQGLNTRCRLLFTQGLNAGVHAGTQFGVTFALSPPYPPASCDGDGEKGEKGGMTGLHPPASPNASFIYFIVLS